MRGMRKVGAAALAMALLVGVAIVGGGTSAAAPPPRDVGLFAQLRGTNEIPPPGDAQGQGVALVNLIPSEGRACLRFMSAGVSSRIAAHIHEGAADVAGPIVVDFTSTIPPSRTKCVRGVDGALLRRIIANPRGFYVNVHTTEFPAGAIRGQLIRHEFPELQSTAAARSGAGAPAAPSPGFFAILNGANEFPPPGDAQGLGGALVNLTPTQGKACLRFMSAGVAARIAAHIHEGPAGVAGPIVVDFTSTLPPSPNKCVRGVDNALLRRIVNNPRGFYVNVHTTEFPAGAVRGQLVRHQFPELA